MESIRKETQEEIVQIQAKCGERCEKLDASVNEVRGQAIYNKQRIEVVQKRENPKIQEELERMQDRQAHILGIHNIDNREGINFKVYQKNPMEFLERVEEKI